MERSSEQVLNDHLERRRRHDLEGDLEANYSNEVVILTKHGVFRGKDGIRHTAQILANNLPDATFHYESIQVADDFGLLGWSARASDGSTTCHGADSYVIKDGSIIAQTIHYEVHGS